MAFAELITITADASDDGAVESVAFVVDGAVLGRSSSRPYHLRIEALGEGEHIITAVATDNAGLTGYSRSVVLTVLPPSGTSYSFRGGQGGDWNDPSNWSPAGIPGPRDSAEIKAGQIASVKGREISVGSLAVGANSGITGSGAITAIRHFSMTGGSLLNLQVVIPVGGQFAVSGDDGKTLSNVAVENSGTTSFAGAGAITGDSMTTFNNFGLFALKSGDTPTRALLGRFNNSGRVQINGSLIAESFTQAAGQLDLRSDFDTAGTPLPQTAILETKALQLEGGTVTGSGTITGDVINSGASVMPGHSIGVVQVQGNYTQHSQAALILEVGDSKGGKVDQLAISGTAVFGGTLSVRTIAGYTPDVNSTFAPITYASASGNFDRVSTNAQISAGSAALELKVSGSNPPAPQALNIATRLRVEAGDNALIGGFIITGTEPKKVILRAIGPSLPLDGRLLDPTLELHKPDGTTVFNDNWRDTQEREVLASTIAPKQELESAIVATLEPGGYSAVLRGNGNTTGVALVEVYDLDAAAPATLANISTRGQVKTGEDVMIAGFILGGTEPAKVLIRAIGPSLAEAGVATALKNPALELHDAYGNAVSNDDWRETQEAEIIATTIAPANDREAAILATLPPGAYTAIVRGKNGTTGVALVECYNLR